MYTSILRNFVKRLIITVLATFLLPNKMAYADTHRLSTPPLMMTKILHIQLGGLYYVVAISVKILHYMDAIHILLIN